MAGPSRRFVSLWEEDMNRRNGNISNRPFSWQLPTATPSSIRTALNEELTFNEQRHFGARPAVRRDSSTSSNAPLLSDWRQASYDSAWDEPYEPDNYLPRRQREMARWDQQSAQHGLDDVLTEQSFFKWYPSGNATLTFHNDDNQLESVHNLNLGLIQERSPFLALGFEESRSGPRLYLETVSSTTVYPFLRYLYSGTYALNGPSGDDLYEDVPTSLLVHCQLYRLGDIYDLLALKTQAYVNVIRNCEFGCSSPDKPIDLCEAIRYIYKHLSTHEKLINTTLDYCVSCFLRHSLGECKDFMKLAYELRPFHQALCKNSRDRGFEDEAALAIIRMPFEPYIPESYSAREDAFAKRFDDVYHFHSDDADSPSKKRKRPEFTLPASGCHYGDLPHRERGSAAEVNRANEERAEAAASKRHYTTRSSSPFSLAAAAASQVTLPLRVANPSKVEDQESDSEVDLPKVRPAADAEGMQSPEPSDTDFEVVEGPAAVQEISQSDSEDGSLVEISHAEAGPVKTARARAPVFLLDDSDSEWEAV